MIYTILIILIAFTAWLLMLSVIWEYAVPFPNKYTAGAVAALATALTLEIFAIFSVFCIFGI